MGSSAQRRAVRAFRESKAWIDDALEAIDPESLRNVVALASNWAAVFAAVSVSVAIACVGFHYYFSAWHPAMVGESPRVVAGLPTGAATYGTYAVAYAAMAAVPMRTAARKPDFKVEMRRGEGAKLMGADAKEQD